MSHAVELPDDLHAKLKAMGGGLFSVPEVIAKLVDRTASFSPPVVRPVVVRDVPRQDGKLSILRTRAPRERGATVEVDGKRIHAGTVSDLYEQVFRLILANGKSEALKALVPFRTSNQRYLIAREPKHPNGNAFFVDVKVGPYHVEAHKNYEQAIKQLADLMARVGVEFRYIG